MLCESNRFQEAVEVCKRGPLASLAREKQSQNGRKRGKHRMCGRWNPGQVVGFLTRSERMVILVVSFEVTEDLE